MPVLKTKHRSVGPRKGVGNAFLPGTINPSHKKPQTVAEYENPAVAFTLGERVHGVNKS